MSHRLVITCLSLHLVLLGGCQGYDFTINERVVYSPPKLFRDFAIEDPALRACVEQTIADQGITAAGDLEALNCSHAGISRLDGLAVFTGLRTLRLSSNRVRNLVELGALVALEAVYLNDNQVVDPVPLYRLGQLREVDLSGNASLVCPRKDGFSETVEVMLPDHCP